MSRIILSNVIENEDNYKWSELNCFYRVFAIALGNSNKIYFDNFIMYVSAYILYGIRGRGNLSFDSGDCILEYYKRELKSIFGNEIRKEDFGGYKVFIKNISNVLNKGNVIIVPCDLFYLPYCKSYMELHKRHYMVVKGIDTEKGIVYILDNMHVDLGASTIYKDFMLDIRVLYDMAVAFRSNFETISNKNYFWSDSSEKNERFEKDNCNYFLRLKENILKNNNCMELDMIDDNSEFDINMQKYLTYANLRVVLYNSLKMYTENEQTKKMLDDTLKVWNTIKLEMAFRDAMSVKEKVLRNIELEKECIRQLGSTNKEKSENKKLNKYTIINRKNAPISQNENIIDIVLDENDIYDIWRNANNGVVLIKEDADNLCSAIMRISTEFGSSSHCGVYIEFVDGRRILFGSLGRLNMAIHAIDNKEKYELCMYQEVVEDKMYIEIKFDDERCYFYSGYDMQCRYTLELNTNIIKVGYFAKTWENCECKVTIEDIKLN